MKFIPLHDFIQVQPEHVEMVRNGIVVVSEAEAKPTRGRVIALGGGKRGENGELIPMPPVKVGDVVAFTKDTLQTFTIGKEKVHLVKADHLIGVEEAGE